jgi:hypothetical protein
MKRLPKFKQLNESSQPLNESNSRLFDSLDRIINVIKSEVAGMDGGSYTRPSVPDKSGLIRSTDLLKLVRSISLAETGTLKKLTAILRQLENYRLQKAKKASLDVDVLMAEYTKLDNMLAAANLPEIEVAYTPGEEKLHVDIFNGALLFYSLEIHGVPIDDIKRMLSKVKGFQVEEGEYEHHKPNPRLKPGFEFIAFVNRFSGVDQIYDTPYDYIKLQFFKPLN